LRRITYQAPLVAEDWTLTVAQCNQDASQIKFTLLGSVTGFDGEGNSLEDFVSNSKRVVIPGGSDNWGGIGFGLKYRSENGPRPLPEDFKITWKSYRLASDTVQFPDAEKVGIERRITLVQGITSSEHVLRLAPLPGKTLSIKCFRVFMPPL
jgi:hypothetical protein